MRITVTNSHEHAVAAQVAAVGVPTNPNMNGADVEYGDYLSIDGCDEIAGCRTLSPIHGALDADKA